MPIVPVKFNNLFTINCDSETPIKTICLQLADELGLNPMAILNRESWLLSAQNGSYYIQNPFTNDSKIGTFLISGQITELFLQIVPLCIHGSPMLPHQGFPCGWC
jgi:hypothetical protein